MTDEQIEAAARAMYALEFDLEEYPWNLRSDAEKLTYREMAHAAFLAAALAAPTGKDFQTIRQRSENHYCWHCDLGDEMLAEIERLRTALLAAEQATPENDEPNRHLTDPAALYGITPDRETMQTFATPESGWRPIETSPKDGTMILVCWALGNIARMRERCRVPSSRPDSTSGEPAPTARPFGSSSTAASSTALARAKTISNQLKRRSQNSSETNRGHPSATVIPLKS